MWNIFIPDQLLNEPPGYLVGSVYLERKIACVHGLIASSVGLRSTNVIGTWQKGASLCSGRPTESCWISLTLLTTVTEDIRCKFIMHTPSESESATEYPNVCILFSPKDIMSSFILMRFIKENNTEMESPSCNSGGSEKEIVTVLSESLSRCNDSSNGVKYFHQNFPMKRRHVMNMLTAILLIPLWILFCFGSVVEQSVQRYSGIIGSILPSPAICQHLLTRYKHSWSQVSGQKQRFQQFMLYNACGQQLLDTFVGVSLCLFIVHCDLSQSIAAFILDWAEDIAHELTTLVQWLMGAPAGLKLNAQLTKIMGHFFLYHIYLWTGYLALLRTVMPSIIWYLSCVGVLGVSSQLCLVQDVISMLTLHIYCFYVYAARAFYLQVYILSSLWRLFRGKKWNVLRSRVDSALYNTDQLFVGTLLFTMLLFLLPTITLYYAVFTLLRVVVLCVQGLLAQLTTILTRIPVFALLARILAPRCVTGDYKFTIIRTPQNQECLVLNMKIIQLSLTSLMKLSSVPSNERNLSTHTWAEFLSNLATGKLIYPWVNKGKKTKVD